MKTLLAIAVVTLGLSVHAIAAKAGWDDDYAKGLQKAAAEKKMVLLDFTGSDWCGWCMKLDSEVFSKSPFKSFAKQNLVLVELDYPHGKKLSKKLQEQNAGLKTKYGISGYPTLILLDAEGKEMTRWVGYKADLLAELKAKAKAQTPSAAK